MRHVEVDAARTPASDARCLHLVAWVLALVATVAVGLGAGSNDAARDAGPGGAVPTALGSSLGEVAGAAVRAARSSDGRVMPFTGPSAPTGAASPSVDDGTAPTPHDEDLEVLATKDQQQSVDGPLRPVLGGGGRAPPVTTGT